MDPDNIKNIKILDKVININKKNMTQKTKWKV